MQTIRLLCALCASALISVAATPAQGEMFRAGRLLCSSSPRIGILVGSTCVAYSTGEARRNATSTPDG